MYFQGAIRHMWDANPVFGIEAWYVQEGQGKELEAATREKKVLAEIQVAPSGKARLKGLIT
ncbi:MAG: GDYXXLXY domain-containing protein [Planctomycetota bacterium]|nr:GDYXXLXY domain-containing protein [Planctomycetota bacterium]